MWGGGALALVLIVVGIVIARGGNGDYEKVTVSRRDITEEVRVSGTVEARIISDLGFETGGVVRDVRVKESDVVFAGQTLARLGLGTLPAELQSAQADVAIKQSEVNNTAINLDTIKEKQDTLVRNAKITLFSDDLVAEPKSDVYTQTPPLISGRYTGIEGIYKLVIHPRSTDNHSDLFVFGPEEPGPVEISETAPTPIGTHGLFVTFPTDPRDYEETSWYIAIPNTKSNSYAENYNAYQDALRERQRALDEASSDIREQGSISIATAELQKAEADVARIQALIGERILRAPFTGTVTSVVIDPGESVTSGTSVISLISNDAFGVAVDLPEIDSFKVHTGDPATILLDAFPDTPFAGTVASVNRAETMVDGVSVYESRVAFIEEDPRVASGMTADVSIVTDTRQDVLAVPARAIQYHNDGTTYVLVVTDSDDKREVEVAVGLRGSDGFVEVAAGLSESDIVLVPTAAQ